MVNQIVLVGRVVKTPELRVTDGGKKISSIVLAVPRNYKNSDGQYDTDFLDYTFQTGMEESTADYCKKEDLV